MATTTKKSTSKAKTKTAKAKSSPQKATSKKVTPSKSKSNKTSSTKVATKASLVSRASIFKQKNVTLHSLRNLNMVAVGLFILLALVASYIMSAISYSLTLGHVTRDALASTNTTVFAPAVQSIYDVEVRWLVIIVMLLSAILPILYLTKLKERYAEYLNNTHMQPFRWADLAITSGLMTATVALLSGVSDLPTLKFIIAGTVVMAAALGLIAERQNNAVVKPVRSAFMIGIATSLLPWLLIATYAATTIIYGMVRSPWYVYALYITLLTGLAIHIRNQRMAIRGANHLIVERNYIAISILTKVAFAIILIIGLAR